ncbi:MAG: hypothetical protein L6R38_001439 [Xanthoria sp. 2 TBL-2021]|nr:MAG: hypothetical protein L6R38_001439 [Xanthoria sp. 2 TBL-2021]
MAASEPEKTSAYKYAAQYLPEYSRNHLRLLHEPLPATTENARELLFKLDLLSVELRLCARHALDSRHVLEERRRALEEGLAADGHPEAARGFRQVLDKAICEMERVRLEFEAMSPRIRVLRCELLKRVRMENGRQRALTAGARADHVRCTGSTRVPS